MPGVIVTTTARGDASSPLADASGQFFVVGLAERGRTDRPVLIRGLADFEANFGGRTTYSHLYDTVRTYFEEDGNQVWVARVVGAGAVRGSVTVPDRATTPVPTLTVRSRSEGSWSEDMDVIVSAGSLGGTVRVAVEFDGDVVEVYNNIASVQDIVSRFAGSPYIEMIDAGSATAAPDNLPAVGTYSVTAGTDDRAAVTTQNYLDALELFTEGLGDGAVAIPGQGAAVHEGLVNHARANRRIALLSTARDVSISEITTAATSVNSDAAGLFAPWVLVSDNAGGTRAIPPEGYVAGVRARAHQEVGPWRAPAGGIAVSRSTVGVYTEYTKAEANSLDESKVSVIRRINNTTRLYGWRSLSNDTMNFGMLNARDLLNRLVVDSEGRLEQYVFAPVDGRGQLLSSINAELTGILEPIRQAGGLYERIVDGEQIDPGYVVETGSTVNTEATLANNEVRARVSIRVSPVGALISLTIVKVGLRQGL
jgi:hypothetical protein